MKLSIYCWRNPDTIKPGDIVAIASDPTRPLHIGEVRATLDGIELYGLADPATGKGRRRRLPFAGVDGVFGVAVMVLPDTDLAFDLWSMVRNATAGQLTPPAASMPGPLADEAPAGLPLVQPGDTEDIILVRHGATTWNVRFHGPEDDAAPDSDDEGT